MEEIFVAAVKMLKAKGYIKLENYFVDGTKIESASGRYTFVWKKGVEKNDAKPDEKPRAYVRLAEAVRKEENEEYGERDLEELGNKAGYTSADVKELAAALVERIEKLEAAGAAERKKKLEKALKTVRKDYLPGKQSYEKAKRICGQRNSYSKTDRDATFMRMKEDHRGKGQPKPGYNVQIGTEGGFVLGYDLFPNPADSRTLKAHLRRQKKRLGADPEADFTPLGEHYQATLFRCVHPPFFVLFSHLLLLICYSSRLSSCPPDGVRSKGNLALAVLWGIGWNPK